MRTPASSRPEEAGELHRGRPLGAAALGDALSATASYDDLKPCDALIICVPTPLTSSREPDLTHLVDNDLARAGAAEGTGRRAGVDDLPGHHPERVMPILEESGLAAGRDFNLAFSHERIDPGRTDYTVPPPRSSVGSPRTAPRPRPRSTARSATRSCASRAPSRRS